MTADSRFVSLHKRHYHKLINLNAAVIFDWSLSYNRIIYFKTTLNARACFRTNTKLLSASVFTRHTDHTHVEKESTFKFNRAT